MSQPIANLPPPTPAAATPAQTNPGAAFQQAIANDAFQQLLLTNQLATAASENQANTQFLPLLTVLEDTGQLPGTYLQDFPPDTNPQATNPAAGTGANPAVTGAAANFNLPGNAPVAAFTTSGLLLSTLLQQLYGLGTTAQAQAQITGPYANVVGGPTANAATTAAVQANPVAEQLLVQIAGNPRIATTPTTTASRGANTGLPPEAPAANAPGATVAPPATPAPTTDNAVPLPPQTNTTINVVANAGATAQNMVVPAQAPIIVGLNGGTPPTPQQSAGFPDPVAAPVAASALPSAQVGDRPAMAGNRLAAIAEQAAMQQSAQSPSSTGFQNTLNQSVSATGGAQARISTSTPTPPPAQTGPQSQAAPTQTARQAPPPAPTPTAQPQSNTPVGTAPATPSAMKTNAAAGVQTSVAATNDASAKASTQAAAPQAAASPRAAANAPTVSTIAQPSSSAGPSASANGVGTSAPIIREAISANAQAAAANAAPTPTTNTDGTVNVAASTAYANNSTGNLAASTPSPAPSATAGFAPTLASQVAESVVTHAQNVSQNGTSEFRIRLDPPELGPVNVQLVSTGDEIRGHVIVSSESVRQMIESQLPELRQRLEASGVTIQNFSVSADPSGGGRNPGQGGTPANTPMNDQEPVPAPAANRFRASATPKRGQVDVVV